MIENERISRSFLYSLTTRLWKGVRKKLPYLAVGGILLGVGEYAGETEVNRIYLELRKDNLDRVSMREKVELIRSQPGYQPTNILVEFYRSTLHN
ncbi:MAG: hypothetical protein AABX11_07870 [Nanoarchaeota archaeon]